jgi:hypothetical protein
MESLFCFQLKNWENLDFFSTVKSTKFSFLGEISPNCYIKKLKKNPEYDAAKISGQFLHPKKAFFFATSSRNLG